MARLTRRVKRRGSRKVRRQRGSGDEKPLYTVLMWDPDAPNPSFLHLFKINTEDIGGTIGGETLLSYFPPSPPSGVHRYYTSVYKQPGLLSIKAPMKRDGFSVKGFVHQYGLTLVKQSMKRVSA